jgi:acyl-coenzyme A synthetase/AMP-(fatty) acid ligase
VLRDGWYHSGDVMRRDPDGFYTFVGRADDMFVCSGENIYPGEVERVLESHPAVRQAAVVPLPDDERGQMPVAFVVIAPGESLTAIELQRHALTHAAPHLHPRRVAVRDELPLAGTNKVDRSALRAEAARLEAAGGWEE